MEKIDLKAEYRVRKSEVERQKYEEQLNATKLVEDENEKITEALRGLVHDQISSGFLVVEQDEQSNVATISIQKEDDNNSNDYLELRGSWREAETIETRHVYSLKVQMEKNVTSEVARELVNWLHEKYNLNYDVRETESAPQFNQAVYRLYWGN